MKRRRIHTVSGNPRRADCTQRRVREPIPPTKTIPTQPKASKGTTTAAASYYLETHCEGETSACSGAEHQKRRLVSASRKFVQDYPIKPRRKKREVFSGMFSVSAGGRKNAGSAKRRDAEGVEAKGLDQKGTAIAPQLERQEAAYNWYAERSAAGGESKHTARRVFHAERSRGALAREIQKIPAEASSVGGEQIGNSIKTLMRQHGRGFFLATLSQRADSISKITARCGRGAM